MKRSLTGLDNVVVAARTAPDAYAIKEYNHGCATAAGIPGCIHLELGCDEGHPPDSERVVEPSDQDRVGVPPQVDPAAALGVWAAVLRDNRQLRQVMRSNPTLARLVRANTVSAAGNSAIGYVLQTVVLLLTGSTVAAGGVRAAATMPSLIFAPLAGVVVDTFDRRRVMLVGQAIGMAATTAMSVLAFVVGLPIGPVFAIGTFVEQAAVQFANAASSVAVRDLAPADQVQEAVQWDEARLNAANIMGRFCGPSLAQLSVWLPFGLNFASYAQFLATVVRRYQQIPSGKHEEAQTVREAMSGLRDGWLWVIREPVLRVETMTLVFFNAAFSVLTLRALTVVSTAPWWVIGAMAATSGLGGLVGALGLSTLLKRSTVKVIYSLATVGLAVFAVVQAVTAVPLWIALGMFAVSVCGSAKNVAITTCQFETCPRELIGRALGARSTAFHAGVVLGSAAGGFLLSALGIGLSGWVAAAVVAAMAVVANLVMLVRWQPSHSTELKD